MVKEGKPETECPRKTISTSGGFEQLQMVSELDTEQCANEIVGPYGGWIVKSHIGWRGKRKTKPYS